MDKLYPISPPQIIVKEFIPKLRKVLAEHKPHYFQLRLKDVSDAEIINAAEKIIPICHEFGTKFIMNDSVELALKVGADGVHLGYDEFSNSATQQLSNLFVGVSCYNSLEFATNAVAKGANMVSFGAFFPTTTKVTRARAELETLRKFRTTQPRNYATTQPLICAIGGINFGNYHEIEKAGADYICMISALWG